MEIKLLKQGYQNDEQIFLDFMNNSIDFNSGYFSNEIAELESAPDFPIYINMSDESIRLEKYREAILTMKNSYINTSRDLHFNGLFWHSLLLTKRDFIMEEYGDKIDSYKAFKNIVFKKFDWENYIYKTMLITEYIFDYTKEYGGNPDYYIEILINNLDLFNYVIKYKIFRNKEFIINFFLAIKELGIVELLKKQIPNRPDLGKDERYGRLVFMELNNVYPVVMAPLLPLDALKDEIIKALSLYTDVSKYIK